MAELSFDKSQNLLARLHHVNWGLVLVIFAITGIGVACLYSAAGGDFSRWASKHVIRFGLGLAALFIVALIDIRWWYKLTWPIYFCGMALLVIVEVMGHTGMGAQRWIDLGVMKLQPSELMKLAVVMALARYFHTSDLEDMKSIKYLIIPVIIVFAPVGLVLLQPDLGTSLMIIGAGGAMFFMAGAPVWMFLTIFALNRGEYSYCLAIPT